jgi:hypothetical protein
MPIAYSYKRFSSDAQEGNDSIRRQTAAAQRFIDDHPEYGLVLDRTLSLVDAGVSAYKGIRGLRSVVTSARFNSDCSELTIRTISGKTVVEERPDRDWHIAAL